jgi:hypothetical protein
MAASAIRTLLCVLLFSALVVQGEALWAAAFVGSGATMALYMTGAALGPVGFGAVFLSTTFGAQYLGKKMDEEVGRRRLYESQLHSLRWTNCSIPSTFTTHRSCISKHHCEDQLQVIGSLDCNACGANTLVARKWTAPLDTWDSRRDVLCKDAAGQVYAAPSHNTPHGYWNCNALPHYPECKKCGADTAFARYETSITSAGLLLTCIRTDGLADRQFV